MSTPGGRRRSLLAEAVDKIGTASAIVAEPSEAELADRHTPALDAPAPSFLGRRGAAMDEIARAVKRPTIRIKPAECSVWPGNARDYASLSRERCETLIDSIREEGGNREPVVIRRVQNGDQQYELIVGTRRHFSIAWLNANHHTEIDLIARIETLDDEAAFRLADIENREREDVTDLERARNYQHAVDAYYNGVRSQMAKRLAISAQNLHNLLQLAELPDEVVGAFAIPTDLKIRHGMRLSPLLKDPARRDGIIAVAVEIAEEQRELRASGSERIEGSRVCDRLAAGAPATVKPKTATKSKAALTAASGKEVGRVLNDTRAKGLTLSINPKETATVDEILEALRPILEAAKFNK